MNGLSHIHDIKDKSHFAVSLIRGLGGNLTETARDNFAREVQIKVSVSYSVWSLTKFIDFVVPVRSALNSS